ncbi:HAMP domain-containing histidine kinase [Alteromonas sp. a30]|nr:HAMP domain-containing histidine kinase [Alteromonas sp. a30]
MSLRFYQQLAITLVALFIAFFAVFLFWLSDLHEMTKSEAEQKLHLQLAEHLVSDSPLLKTGAYDYEALSNLFHTLMVLGPNFEFYYLDSTGKVLTYSAPPEKVKRTHVDLAPIKTLLSEPSHLPVLGDDPRNPGKNKIFSAAPVMNNGTLQGYLYVIIGGEIHDSIWENLIQNQTMKEVVAVGITSVAFLLVVLLLLFRWFTLPIQKLTNEMETLRDNGFNQGPHTWEQFDWDEGSRNEVERLGGIFHEMLDQIHSQFETLKNLDDHRRTLLADLSHDLRTPLANLQGYIETLSLNSDKLSEEEKSRFIDISLRNARNLKRLIDQIFELAYLESGQVKLYLETFPLGELLHDVAAKFDLKARDRNIGLQVVPEKFNSLVYADIEKLERVLTNLIENALRHTPEYGQVLLKADVTENKIRVSVEDTGVGISKNEVAFIFDARYQASNTKPDRNLHAGLGLAISRKLIKLQDSDIVVESRLGQGTCFTFDLKRVIA